MNPPRFIQISNPRGPEQRIEEDVLGSIVGGLDYDALLPASVTSKVGDVDVRFLGLRKLIEVKEALGRDKDKAVLAILKHTLLLSEK